MPLSKLKQNYIPLWKKWDMNAQKQGFRHTVYTMNGDKYIGEWDDNKKDGKGFLSFNKGQSIYKGDWKNDLRHGHGILSIFNQYTKEYHKEYSGGWKFDLRHGYGTRYFGENKYYEGEWYANLRCGWGRMFYKDGSVYEGEWLNDQRSGEGMLRLPNNDRYDGKWSMDMKNGEGKFLYTDKGQLYTGWWLNNVPKCGIFENLENTTNSDPVSYQFPKCTLTSPNDVLSEAKSLLLNP